MLRWVQNAIRAMILASAMGTASADAEAQEELPPEPAADSPLRLLEESPEVLEFARKLNQQLDRQETRKTPSRRSGWTANLRGDALNGEACLGNCPICGSTVKPQEDFTQDKAIMGRSRKPAAHWLFEDIDVGELREEAKNKGEAKLLPGEPAQVILELRERLGASALEGSEFTVKPDALAKLIRALDREAQQEEQNPAPYSPPLEPLPTVAAEIAENHEAAVSALRSASRQLDEAADLLEQQNLFERADELRAQADRLRCDARAYFRERIVPQPATPSFEQSSAPTLIEQRGFFYLPHYEVPPVGVLESRKPNF